MFYHSWAFWHYGTIGVVLWVFNRVVSRIQATQAMVVKKLTPLPGNNPNNPGNWHLS